MAEDIRTFRETELVVAGINSRLTLMISVFAAAVAIAAAMLGYMIHRVDGLTQDVSAIESSSSKQEEQLGQISDQLSKIVTGIQSIPAKLNVAPASPNPILPGQAPTVEVASALALYGLAPEILTAALRKNDPPERAFFALASINDDLISRLKDALGGNEVGRSELTIAAIQLYALPDALIKIRPNAIDNLLLLSNDKNYMDRLKETLASSR